MTYELRIVQNPPLPPHQVLIAEADYPEGLETLASDIIHALALRKVPELVSVDVYKHGELFTREAT